MREVQLRGLAPGRGITSVCSAHPTVIEAALLQAAGSGRIALIEATCNQVNQDGGYTGLDPAGFRALVLGLADTVGLERSRVLLGGDHLGPNPWRDQPAEAAMRRAEAMVAAYVAAGFEKIHLDCSMGCGGEPDGLADPIVAARAARLAVVAEAAAAGVGTQPIYVVGTEVPTPGGGHDLSHLVITDPAAARATHAAHQEAFAAAGVAAAFDRVIGLVVQPGVEFGHSDIAVYRPELASGLTALPAELGVVFEAHSTDYQPPEALVALVRDGFAILKVGPALTFALREALYGLDAVAMAMDPGWAAHSLVATMEQEMLADPSQWRAHYHGTSDEQRRLRTESYSDRIRYYWPTPPAREAVARLLRRLSGATIPEPLREEFLPRATPGASPRQVVLDAIRDVLRVYAAACSQV